MSNLPHFVQDQRDNVVWKHLANHRQNWLEKRIRSLLKNESLATRYVYGYLRYVDKDNRGFAYPAQSTIAKAVKVSPRHVIRCLSRLVELDLIIRGKKGGHSYYIFTLPASFKETRSPLEANLEEITKEVKELKEKALVHHLEPQKTQGEVTSPCHTNKTKIYKKIKEPTSQDSFSHPKSPSSPRSSGQKQEKRQEISTEIPPKKIGNPETDWFDWIEEKKNISLTNKEIGEVGQTQERILNERKQRFKGFPESFLNSYAYEIALAYVLRQSRNLIYTGSNCLLNKEMNL